MLRSIAFGLCACFASVTAAAQSAPEATVPPQLRDWRPWVLKDLEYRACPFLATQAPSGAGDYLCAWPGRLTINAVADGATFAIHWRVEAPTWVPLPGDEERWPQQVTVNGQRQPVMEHDGSPALWLGTGSYEVAGRIPWRERPQTLAVPERIGLVALNVDGKGVAPIQRDGGELTLGRGAATAPEADSLQVRVFRKLSDVVPAELDTQIQFYVSGKAREEIIGPALASGFVPLSLSGAWPGRLDEDGRLHVQVQPGSETLTLIARATAPLTRAAPAAAPAPWPAQEIWSFDAAPNLRIASARGGLQVDPRQAGVPSDWFALPAFALSQGAALEIEQRSRGLALDEGNRLTLQREAWLDFGGDAWYARDRLAGSMQRGWRFDVAVPLTLERAEATNSHRGDNGGNEPLLVTRGAGPDLTGVEWRTPQVALAASVRIASAGTALPVTGWHDSFDRVDTTLHFPFGYKLLAAPGADSATGSWMSQWTLLDAFVCAILALLAWRLLGVAGAAISSGYLLLGYQEPGAPFWTVLGVLAFALVVRALPQGTLRKVADGVRRTLLALLVLWALPFIADEVRSALYPQLENGVNLLAMFTREAQRMAEAPLSAPQPMAVETLSPQVRVNAPPPPAPAADMAAAGGKMKYAPQRAEPKKEALQTIAVTASNIQRADLIDHYSESTVVQTGSGEPSWTLGSSARLDWGGPVLATQTVRLVIAPPWLVRGLRVVLVVLLGLLAWRIHRASRWTFDGAAPLKAGVLVLAGMIAVPQAHAQGYPSDALLDQLRSRLSEAPKCAPACATLAQAEVAASGDSVTVIFDAQAAERVALPLPGVDATATLRSVKVDGVADDAVVRAGNAALWLTLSRGVHRVEIEYTAYADRLALAFPLKPARVLFSGNGWEASGIDDDRLLAETLNLSRARPSATGKIITGAQQFPPYVRVTRSITLGLEWSVEAQVQRMAPEHGGFTVAVPALAGEHVTTPGVKVENGKVLAAMAEETLGANWSGSLDKADSLTLTAPPLGERAEVWRVVVSPTWHAEFAGVPETIIDPAADAADYRNFEFNPLPGETLTIKVSRPAAVPGQTRAIDSVSLGNAAGQHASTHTLNFSLRASQGGEQTLTLPADAEVTSVRRDGQALNLRPLDGKLSLPVVPGRHAFAIEFREPAEIGWITRTPLVALGSAAANIGVSLNLPADRWLLATWGPAVGPAVLYWGELVVMVLVAYALSRTRRTRLKFRDWLLLGIGFSTFSWGALLVVVAWLFAFDWRGRTTLQKETPFNFVQVGLVLLTLGALLCLISAIPQGLLGQPAMHVAGHGSSEQSLQWFLDRSNDALPQAAAFSVPLWVYKVLMLAWALWLANALIGWLREAFSAWTSGGYWRSPVVTASPLETRAEASAENKS